MSTAPDEQDPLVARIRAHDKQALAEFLAARRGALLAYIERHTGAALRRKLEPEDIFQEASAEAVRALPITDLTEREPFGWLCQIAERRIVDAHRRFFGAQKRDAAREMPLGTPGGDQSRLAVIDLLVASMTTASQAYSRGQKEIQLLAAMDTLPTEQREALRLRYLEGLPSKEIAERLGKTDGAVRVMLTRSLSKLQQILGPDAAPS
jgi:RNA polymerase sigma-70 factor (ECF subfamily)